MRGLFIVGVCVAVGCTVGDPSASATETSTGTTASSSSGSETGTSSGTETGTSDAPTSTSTTVSSSTTTTATSTEPTTGMVTTSTTSEPISYCNGFDNLASEPFFAVTVKGGEPLADGVVFPLECGVQGLWMFALHPTMGGFDPGGEYPHVSVTVDVEGFNIGPTGHFFEQSEGGYYIGCEQLDGGVPGIVPVFPPDELAMLAAVDGLPGQVHIEIETDGGPLAIDAMVTMSAPKELVAGGCNL